MGAIVVFFNPLGKPKDAEPQGVQLWPVAELPKAVTDKPMTVRVAFPHPLFPTSDPRVFTYSGAVVDVLPKVYEIHFAAVPEFTRPPIVVEGVATFVPDAERRGSGAAGFVRLEQARVAP